VNAWRKPWSQPATRPSGSRHEDANCKPAKNAARTRRAEQPNRLDQSRRLNATNQSAEVAIPGCGQQSDRWLVVRRFRRCWRSIHDPAVFAKQLKNNPITGCRPHEPAVAGQPGFAATISAGIPQQGVDAATVGGSDRSGFFGGFRSTKLGLRRHVGNAAPDSICFRNHSTFARQRVLSKRLSGFVPLAFSTRTLHPQQALETSSAPESTF